MANDQSFHFPPILNGMDFLNSAVEQLVSEEDNSLKYAVLHLQAAAEILFKMRLIDEHWSLVFKNPGLADREAYERGDFESCGTDATIERLQKIIGVEIPDKSRSRLKVLAQYRNQLQHYGATRESAHAVKAVAAEVLDFLLVFLDGWIGPDPGSEGFEKYHELLGSVRENVKYVEALVDRRLKRIERELKASDIGRVTGCFSCGHWTLVFDSIEVATCRFCLNRWDNLSLRHHGEFLPHQKENSTSRCSDCNEPTFMLEVEEAANHRFEVCLTCWTLIFGPDRKTALHWGATRFD